MSQSTILTQLKRIDGQFDGVLRMYQEGRSCIELVRQLIAVRNSLTKVARDALANEAQVCASERNVEQLDAVLQEMFKY